MLHGNLPDLGTYSAYTGHEVWQKAFQWLRDLPSDVALGHYEIGGRRMFASVQGYETQPREDCRFESHEEHIDIQYTIHGVEGIDWSPRSVLRPAGAFANDVQFWLPPDSIVTTLAQYPGRFAIFFPEDAHRPKVRLGAASLVKKLVIKIHRDLLT